MEELPGAEEAPKEQMVETSNSFVGAYEIGWKEDNNIWNQLKINEDGTCAYIHFKHARKEEEITEINTITGTY